MNLDAALEKRIRTTVVSLEATAVEHLSALVRENSQLGHEAGAQEYMAGWFRRLGLALDRFEVDPESLRERPGFSPPLRDYAGRENVVGVHRPSGPASGRSLILNGHIDVVPPGPARLWTTPPFEPALRDGRLYGRGSGDMKAGIVAYTIAFEALRGLGLEPAAPVFLQSVIEEECTGNGALACLARGYAADAAIIPEPFNQQLLAAQVGVMWARIRVSGRPSHVLDTASGLNAIEAAYRLFEALRGLEAEWNAPERRHPAFAGVDHPLNFSLGRLEGGDWASTVPAEASMEVRLGFYPGVQPADVRQVLEETLEHAVRTDPLLSGTEVAVAYRGFQAEGCVMDSAHPMVPLLTEIHRRVTDTPLEPFASTATTDARFFQLYGETPATCYGPRAGNIHAIDESVSVRSLMEVATVLALFIAEWCGVNERRNNDD